MTTFKRHTSTSLLPDGIFSYTDAQFYDIVKRIVDESAAELLKIQSVRSPNSLLQIRDGWVWMWLLNAGDDATLLFTHSHTHPRWN